MGLPNGESLLRIMIVSVMHRVIEDGRIGLTTL